MIQIIAGSKGKGKTKILLDKVNTEAEVKKGNIVYLDKSTKHMYELSKEVRLINVKDYLVDTPEEFIGFVCGIISQDHDLEKVFLDSFLNITCVENKNNMLDEAVKVVNKLETVSAKYNVDFIISASVDSADVPEAIKDKVIVAL